MSTSSNVDEILSSPSQASPEAITEAQPKTKSQSKLAKLTQTQLAHKRAKDRESQRAARAKTKQRIRALETELAELRSCGVDSHSVRRLMDHNVFLEHEITRLQAAMSCSRSFSPCCCTSGTPNVGQNHQSSMYMQMRPTSYHSSYWESPAAGDQQQSLRQSESPVASHLEHSAPAAITPGTSTSYSSVYRTVDGIDTIAWAQPHTMPGSESLFGSKFRASGSNCAGGSDSTTSYGYYGMAMT
ncbi:hypothetical protein QQS21_004560 [Conoideocrella luteorostrata]|uniref:BZIP domain-containing protein n=1 Tax=Conoideocrella luteorostrata TaxID=1105319 RepID=A0AAJ0FVC4_9HYPO|nr:hypothetical protein QQS21_004560 [Conoideocrella luteorostrata]